MILVVALSRESIMMRFSLILTTKGNVTRLSWESVSWESQDKVRLIYTVRVNSQLTWPISIVIVRRQQNSCCVPQFLLRRHPHNIRKLDRRVYSWITRCYAYLYHFPEIVDSFWVVACCWLIVGVHRADVACGVSSRSPHLSPRSSVTYLWYFFLNRTNTKGEI